MQKNKYQDGIYKASAKGKNNIAVTVKIQNNHIKKVTLASDKNNKFTNDTFKILRNQILDKQSANIDGVTGASLTSRAVKEALGQIVEKAQGKEHKQNLALKDGTFTGTANGHGGRLEVKLTAKNNQLTNLKVTKNHESPDIATAVLREIPKQIVAQQTLGVDVITGASLTSQAIIDATSDALTKASGDVLSWKEKPYHNPNTFQAHDFDTNLLIVGAGMAGLATAAFALKNGIKDVTILEKNSRIGGSLRYATGGFVAVNSENMKKEHYDDSLSRVMNWVHQDNDGTTRNGINEDFVQYLLKNTGKTLDQMIAMTNSKVELVLPDPYLHVVWARNGADTAQRLEKYIRDHGGRILTDINLDHILVKEGQAIGVEANNRQGDKFKVKANNIVISTGGTSYNHEELMNKVTPGIEKVDIHNEANEANTGAGYDALLKVDARPDGEDVYKNGFIMAGNTYDLALMPNLYQTAMLLNAEGKRFTNEVPFDYGNITTAMFEEASPAYYLIFDGNLIDKKFAQKLNSQPNTFMAVAKAKTISELAKQLGLGETTLQDTINTYNRIVNAGVDPLGKDKKYLKPFTGQSGYYGLYVRPGSWGTMGGVKINRKMQVIKNDGSVYPNLFAAGETATGDLFSEYYMGAFSLGYYSTEGRLIAEELKK